MQKKLQKGPSITEVAERLFPGQNLRHLLCPFHDDHSPGSFHLFDRNNAYKCFSCGAFGHTVDLVKKVKNCSDREAYAFMFQKKIPRRTEEKKTKRRDYDLYSSVYSVFLEMNPLSERHRAYLTARAVPITSEYCTMPSRSFLPSFLERVSQENLHRVPGFYRHRETGKMDMVETEGIGIGIRDMQGRITGIQVRRDNVKEGQSRYFWFSSGWIQENRKAAALFSGGGSPDSSIDVLQPLSVTDKEIFVTEGHFKAVLFRKAFGCNAVSLQGIGNYAGLKELLSLRSLRSVYLCFDSDLAVNPAVFHQLQGCVEYLRKITEFMIYILSFPVHFGKGADDALLVCKDCFYAVEADYYFTFYRQYRNMLEKGNFSRKEKEELYDALAYRTIWKKEFQKRVWE